MDCHLQKALEEIQRATQGMSTEELAWHPVGKWSSAQILEHLTLTFSGTVKGMQRVLASDGTGSRKRTLKNRLSAFIVADLGYFPSGRKSPDMAVPSSGNPDMAVENIVRNLTEMDVVLTEVEQKKGPNARVPHPVIGPLKISQWRRFHLLHTRHHMKQIVRLRELAS
jgi:Protein of unknown function (DUF1569)